MQKNEMIGIAGVFLLTFCLIALYHLMAVFGRHRKRYDAQTKRGNKPNQNHRPDQGSRRSSDRDDAWLLWSPELAQSGEVRKGRRQDSSQDQTWKVRKAFRELFRKRAARGFRLHHINYERNFVK